MLLFRRTSIVLGLTLVLVFLWSLPALAGTTYLVKPGDSLYKIAKRFGTTVKELQGVNKLGNRTLIYPGQRLVIPQRGSKAVSTASRGSSGRGVIPFTTQEVDLLARLITAEAGGESYLAQVAVGAVVVNRVQSPIFPNTITKVIYQIDHGRYQFTPVLNGWINKPATAQALRAAREALAGADPTKGALYFFLTGTPNRFLQAKPVATVIDGITFAY